MLDKVKYADNIEIFLKTGCFLLNCNDNLYIVP